MLNFIIMLDSLNRRKVPFFINPITKGYYFRSSHRREGQSFTWHMVDLAVSCLVCSQLAFSYMAYLHIGSHFLDIWSTWQSTVAWYMFTLAIICLAYRQLGMWSPQWSLAWHIDSLAVSWLTYALLGGQLLGIRSPRQSPNE